MAAIAGATLLLVNALRGPGGGRNVAVAELAPPFDLGRSDGGGRVTSDELRGKPVVLTFWATWCPACRDELPELEALHRRAGQDIHVIAVSQEAPRTVLAYAHKTGLTLPLYSGASIFAAYGVDTLPTTIVIDENGFVRAELSGSEDADHLEELARQR